MSNTGANIPSARVHVIADTGGPLSAGTIIINRQNTDANGEVTFSQAYSSDQPIEGNARRATTSLGDGTLYKAASIVGTIDSASGLTVTVQMIPDE